MLVLAAACSGAHRSSEITNADADSRATCAWQWTAPETLLYHGAPFAFGGMGGTPRAAPLGTSLVLIGDGLSISSEPPNSSRRRYGMSIDARGGVEPLALPPFIAQTRGVSMWALPAARASVHLLWKTFPERPVHVVHVSTDGSRWSIPDTVFSASDEMTEAHVAAAAGDDVVVALPTNDAQLSGIVVGTRVSGRWDVSRFSVEHAAIVELSLAVAMNDFGATVVYVRPAPSAGRAGAAPGLYARHRAFRGGWGPETLVRVGPAYSPIPLYATDGTFHVLWRGMGTDSMVLRHAASRDFTTWQLNQVPLPRDVQGMDAVAEGDGARIVMQQSDRANASDIKYAHLVTLSLDRSGFSAFETLAVAGPVSSPTISRIAGDTSILIWSGQRLFSYSTSTPGHGPTQFTSLVPVTLLSRHVGDCRRR
ncbi:MAG: hypothetical protein ABJF01_21980 [bacterium]